MGNARFSQRARLKNKADYSRVFEQPERSSDRYFTVLARINGQDCARLGLAISRKSARSAVVRNRVKRVIRESFRQHQHQLSGIDIVVISRGNLALSDNAQLFASLQCHWQQQLKRLTSLCAQR